MKSWVEDSSPCRKKLHVELSAEEVSAEYGRVLAAYAQGARVPGFRPGRAPRALLERRYAKELRDDLRDHVVPDAYRRALEQEKLDAVAILDVDEPSVKPGEPVRFTVTVDVPPRFELPEYKGIRIEGRKVEIADAAVDTMLENLRAQHARYEDATGRVAAEHDLVQIDFEATLDGQPLEQVAPAAKGLGSARGFWLSLGEFAFLPELAEGMKGAAIGEEREIEVAFREGFTVKELAGRKARYRVKATALRGRILPEVDAAFCGRFAAKTPDELRTRIREELRQAAELEERRRRRDEIAKYLLQQTRMDLPASLLQRETQDAIYELVRENARRGVGQDEIVRHKDRIFEAASRGAGESLKLRYVIHRIAEQENRRVSDAELDAAIADLAGRSGAKPEAFRADLERRHALDDLRDRLRYAKVMDWLLEQAVVSETAAAGETP